MDENDFIPETNGIMKLKSKKRWNYKEKFERMLQNSHEDKKEEDVFKSILWHFWNVIFHKRNPLCEYYF